MIIFRWFGYVLHALAYALYSAVQFISKPGTRFVVPILFMAFSVFYIRPALHDHFHVPLDFSNVFSVVFDAVTFIVLFILCWGYVYLSRSFGLVLGIFPPIARPLRPLGSLQATTDDVRSVVVRLAVPPLTTASAGAAPVAVANIPAQLEKGPKPQRGRFVRWVVFPALGLTGVAAVFAAIGLIYPAYLEHKREAQAAADQAKIVAQQYTVANAMIADGITLDEERVSCSLHGTIPPIKSTSNDSVANNIVQLAQAHTAVFFVQGLDFLAMAKDGWSSMPALKTRFADAEAAVLDANATLDPSTGASGPIAICYVRWPTLVGFGSNTAYVEKSMAAFVHLWNIGHEDGFGSDPRRLVAMGYSAGGNLAAQSVLDLYDEEDHDKLQHPEVILVTIVTPHEGAQAASLSSSTNGIAASLIAKARDFFNFQRDGTDLSSRIDDVEHSPGIMQMMPQSPVLLQIKSQLKERHHHNVELKIINIYSSRDDTVPASSGSLDFADRNIDLPDTGVAHVDFMQAPAGSRMRKVLLTILNVPRDIASTIDDAAVPVSGAPPDASAASSTPKPADAASASQQAAAAPPASALNCPQFSTPTPTSEGGLECASCADGAVLVRDRRGEWACPDDVKPTAPLAEEQAPPPAKVDPYDPNEDLSAYSCPVGQNPIRKPPDGVVVCDFCRKGGDYFWSTYGRWQCEDPAPKRRRK